MFYLKRKKKELNIVFLLIFGQTFHILYSFILLIGFSCSENFIFLGVLITEKLFE